MYMYVYIYIYIHIERERERERQRYNLPPLILNPPNTKKKTLGGNIFVTINLDGGTIAPLINDEF